MSTPTANRIRYPHSKDRKQEAYIIDVQDVDPILLKQKDHLMSMYNTMTNKVWSFTIRHKTRASAFILLELFRPTWTLFEYEYKYHELYKMFDEYFIG